MIKKVLNLLVFASLLTGVLMFSGCSDDEFGPRSSGGAQDAPSTLDFATSQTVKLILNYNVAKGIVTTFDIYSENPIDSTGYVNSKLTPICSGINVSGITELTRTIPSHIGELYLYSPNLFVPMLSYAKIAEGVASFSQIDAETNIKVASVKMTTRNSPQFWKKEIGKYLKKKEDFYSETATPYYKYGLKSPDKIKEIPSEILTAIGQTFPEKQKADPRYLKDASIELKENAEVFITLLHSGAAYNNSFSYVVYEGSKELNDLNESEKMELEVINILQLADVNTNTFRNKPWGVTPGHYVQLLYKNKDGEYVKEFPAGAKIGWILHSSGFDETNFAVKSSYRVFSPPNWNDASDSSTGEPLRTVFFSVQDNDGNRFNCFGFEDQKKYDDDCNDLIFHVESNPVDAIDPPEIINPGEDIVKTESLNGILAYEDKWPNKEDYDLNDVVVKYSSTITYVKKAEKTDATVKKVEDVFSFIHTGAAYHNAFSYKVSINPNKLKSVRISDEKQVVQNYQVVADGGGFIIDLCADVRSVIVPFEYGTTAKVYTVVMEFEEGAVLQTDFASIAAPYNPFITPKEAPKPYTEIHLPMYPPTTTRGDRTLFGTGDDCSDMINLWYVSGVNNQYPFAIHLAGVTDEFTVPREANSIDVTYPDYTKWVESNMTENKDWYLNPKK